MVRCSDIKLVFKREMNASCELYRRYDKPIVPKTEEELQRDREANRTLYIIVGTFFGIMVLVLLGFLLVSSRKGTQTSGTGK